MKLVELSKEKYKGFKIEFKYETDYHYKVNIETLKEGYNVSFKKELFNQTVSKSFTDKLFEDHWENPSAFGYFVGNDLIGILEVSREAWSKRLRLTNIHVDNKHRGKGIGSLLMNKVKEIAKEEGHRNIILETQTCNSKAIEFYLAHGFILGGFDSNCYGNEDVEKNEVRIEFIWVTK